jgi:hypothetical protein
MTINLKIPSGSMIRRFRSSVLPTYYNQGPIKLLKLTCCKVCYSDRTLLCHPIGQDQRWIEQ